MSLLTLLWFIAYLGVQLAWLEPIAEVEYLSAELCVASDVPLSMCKSSHPNRTALSEHDRASEGPTHTGNDATPTSAEIAEGSPPAGPEEGRGRVSRPGYHVSHRSRSRSRSRDRRRGSSRPDSDYQNSAQGDREGNRSRERRRKSRSRSPGKSTRSRRHSRSRERERDRESYRRR